MSIHCNARKEDIEKTVLMPGDPLRAKYIAENFLENAKLVNTVRNMLAYTGTYKGKPVTVFSSGMGMPSMGIYSYELFKFYDVENIIRIGSCGAYNENLNLFDTILVDKSYTEGNFAYEWSEKECHIAEANSELNSKLEETASKINIPYVKGNTLCNDCFDGYLDDIEKFILLKVVDTNWMNHIDDMQIMKNEIFARGFGNQDPILAYKKDGYEMFDKMVDKIRETTCLLLLNANVEIRRREPAPNTNLKNAEAKTYDPKKDDRPQERKIQKTVVNTEKKIGRNDPCPCGSGKKYKNCHGREN